MLVNNSSQSIVYSHKKLLGIRLNKKSTLRIVEDIFKIKCNEQEQNCVKYRNSQ